MSGGVTGVGSGVVSTDITIPKGSEVVEENVNADGSETTTLEHKANGERVVTEITVDGTAQDIKHGQDARSASGQAQVASQNGGTIAHETVVSTDKSTGEGTGTKASTEKATPVADTINNPNVVNEVIKVDGQTQNLDKLRKELATEKDDTKKDALRKQIKTIETNKTKVVDAIASTDTANFLDENGKQTGLKSYTMASYAKDGKDSIGYDIAKGVIGKKTSETLDEDGNVLRREYDSNLIQFKSGRFVNESGLGWGILESYEEELKKTGDEAALAEMEERVNMLNNMGNYAVMGTPNGENAQRGSHGQEFAGKELDSWIGASGDYETAKEWKYANKFYVDPQHGKGDNYDAAQFRNDLFAMGATEMDELEQRLDGDRDRRLDLDEWTAYFEPYNETKADAKAEAERWMTALDANQDGELDTVEYTMANSFLGDGMTRHLTKVAADQDSIAELAAQRGISTNAMQARLDTLLAVAKKSDLTTSAADYILTPEERQFLTHMVETDPELVRVVQQTLVSGGNGAQNMRQVYNQYQHDNFINQADDEANSFTPAYSDFKSFDFTDSKAGTTLADVGQFTDGSQFTEGDKHGFVIDVDKWTQEAHDSGETNSGSISGIFDELTEKGWTNLDWSDFKDEFVAVNNINDPQDWLYYPGQQVYLGSVLNNQFAETNSEILNNDHAKFAWLTDKDEYRDNFASFDTDGNGFLTAQELRFGNQGLATGMNTAPAVKYLNQLIFGNIDSTNMATEPEWFGLSRADLGVINENFESNPKANTADIAAEIRLGSWLSKLLGNNNALTTFLQEVLNHQATRTNPDA